MKAKYVRLNIDLNDDLIDKIKELTNLKTKKEIVNEALRLYRDFLKGGGNKIKLTGYENERRGGK